MIDKDLNKTIEKLKTLTACRPERCKSCKYCSETTYAEYTDYHCSINAGDYIESSVNYEVYNDIEPLNCPLPEDEEREDILTLLSWLEELAAYRKVKEAHNG